MNLKFINPIVFVRDVRLFKAFYAEILGLRMVEDHGPFVLFENHLSVFRFYDPDGHVVEIGEPMKGIPE